MILSKEYFRWGKLTNMQDIGVRNKMYDILDWGAKAAILGLLGMSVQTLREMSREQTATKIEISDMKGDNRRVADRLEFMSREFMLRLEELGHRVERLEQHRYDSFETNQKRKR